MKPQPPSVPALIHADPVYRAVVKAVGYGTVTRPALDQALAGLAATHGPDAVQGATDALLEAVPLGGDSHLRLRPQLHVHCRMLLGPMPTEWATWWQNADGSDRQGKPKRWPPNLSATQGLAQAEPAPAEKDRPAEQPFEGMPSEADLLKATPGRQLRALLLAEHTLYVHSAPGGPADTEALRRMDLIEGEMRRRKNKVPPRPVRTEPDDPDAARFRQAATHRLTELLDMCQYELTRNPPGSVTCEEALRDMGLIVAELRRRNGPSPGLAPAESMVL